MSIALELALFVLFPKANDCDFGAVIFIRLFTEYHVSMEFCLNLFAFAIKVCCLLLSIVMGLGRFVPLEDLLVSKVIDIV